MTFNSCQYHLHATLGNPSNNQSLCLMTIFEITQHHPTQNGTCWEIWTLLFLFFIIIIIFFIIPQNTRNFYQLKNNLLPCGDSSIVSSYLLPFVFIFKFFHLLFKFFHFCVRITMFSGSRKLLQILN